MTQSHHDRPDFARNLPAPAILELANHAPEFYPQPGNPPQGWGFGGFLTIEPGLSGRGANTLWWMGLPNCFWWIDRVKGVAGILGAQVSHGTLLGSARGGYADQDVLGSSQW